MRFLIFSLMITLFCGCSSQTGKSSFPGPPSNLEITKQRFLDENLADSMMIYEPSALQTDSEGNVYVFDEGQMNIKVFDEDGNPLRIIGKRGRGPGEFISNSGFFVYRDSLYTFDQKPQRLNVFSTDGNPETTHSLKVAAPLILKPTGEDYHLGIYSGYTGPESRLDVKYVREHASDFSTEGDGFLQLVRLIPELEGVNDLLKFKLGHVLITEMNEFIYVPIFYGVEIYNEKMQPLGYVPIETLSITNKIGNTIGWDAEGVDKEGNVYIRERNGEVSNIWLLKFNWQKI